MELPERQPYAPGGAASQKVGKTPMASLMNKSCTVSKFKNRFKVSVIGCGNVGATAAYAMLIEGTPSEIVLMDKDKARADGIALDFQHSMAFFDYTKLVSTDSYNDCSESDLIVITAGARQKEGETRLDLIAKNRAILEEIVPELVKNSPDAIILVVTNPVDVLTYEVSKIAGLPHGRVFGSGTMLDTARFRFHLSEKLCLNPKSIEAFILGEHGDSSFPVWSSANIAGKPIAQFSGFNKEIGEEVYLETKNAAYRIINDVGYTCYSIGIVIKEIMVHIFRHSRIVLPLSVPLYGQYGYEGVALSVPCVLDSTGIAEIIEVPLDQKEKQDLNNSVQILKSIMSK